MIDCFPKGVAKLESQVESEGIRRALAGLDRLGRVEVKTLSKVTLAKLQNSLREAADPEDPRPFHMLHYIGHGRHDPESGETFLLFETEEGEVDEVDPEALAGVVGPYDLKLVFLNACQSMQSSALDQTQGFAPGPAATRDPLGDRHAGDGARRGGAALLPGLLRRSCRQPAGGRLPRRGPPARPGQRSCNVRRTWVSPSATCERPAAGYSSWGGRTHPAHPPDLAALGPA